MATVDRQIQSAEKLVKKLIKSGESAAAIKKAVEINFPSVDADQLQHFLMKKEIANAQKLMSRAIEAYKLKITVLENAIEEGFDPDILAAACATRHQLTAMAREDGAGHQLLEILMGLDRAIND